jgi:hypothetical protein
MTAVTACSSSPSETQDPALETSEIAASEPTENLSDADIAEAVTRELSLARGIEPAQVEVDVNRGIVTLAGTVDNILVKDRAERIASMVRGARSVVNNIDVTPSDRSDVEIAADVAAALAADPATESWELSSTVDCGQRWHRHALGNGG